jgi:hypothetical protein
MALIANKTRELDKTGHFADFTLSLPPDIALAHERTALFGHAANAL